MSIRRIAILLVLAGLFLVLRFRLGGVDPAKDNAAAGTGERVVLIKAGESTEAESTSTNAKSREREPEEKLDVDETLAALKATLPGLTKFPEQTLQERILATNALLKKAGIALRFGVDEKLYPSENLLEMPVPAFSQENATPNDILLNSHRALGKHYFLSEGAVLFQDASGG